MDRETYTPAEWDVLQERQKELESEARDLGRERFERNVERAKEGGRGSGEGAARVLQKRLLVPLEEGLRVWVEESRGKRGGKHVALRWVEMLGTPTVSYMVVRTVLDHIHKRPSLQLLSRELCKLLTDEARFRRFQERAPGLFQYRMSSFSTTSYSHMARSLTATMGMAQCQECREAGKKECSHLDVSDLTISPLSVLNVGVKLLDILFTSTVDTKGRPCFERVNVGTMVKGKKREMITLRLAPHVAEWMDGKNRVLSFLSPRLLPMVVPPLRWGPGQRGGYLYALRSRTPLVRRPHPGDEDEEAGEMVYEALNRIQETPWRINRKVLDVLQEIEQRHGGMAGVPLLENEPEPVRPVKMFATEEERKQSEEWRAWRRAASEVKNRNAMRACKAREWYRVFDIACRMAEERAIWFPYNLDFRGRVYPVTDALSPQGDDMQKGMLTFAEGAPMGAYGGAYLAVHGLNCLGEAPWGSTGPGTKTSKWTLGERVQWAEENTEAIRGVAEDPFGNRWWMEADEPMQFLAFCFEWAEWEKSGRSLDHVCSLPVSQDGSCNGLQHFSAMFRDEAGGQAVNLIPQDRPQDIYARIAESVTAKLQQLAAAGDVLAELWMSSGLVDRSLCKRPTMTFGYGSKRFGFVTQIGSYLHDKHPESYPHFTARDKGDFAGACGLMATLIWESLGEIVTAAQEGMAWMQSWAREVARTGDPVEWVVPFTGFRVRQEYFVQHRQQVRTILAGQTIWPVRWSDTEEVEARRQVSGVAPNVVHSLDAAALMMTVTQAAAEGVERFAMVHDSYGTCPGDAEVLARCTRQSFVRLYREDVAGMLEGQWRKQAGEVEEQPEQPERGDLDLSGVLVSDYFFA